MEYLPEYGAQCLTPSELTHQWISLYVRPGAELYRGMLICFVNELYLITLNIWGITQLLPWTINPFTFFDERLALRMYSLLMFFSSITVGTGSQVLTVFVRYL